MEKNNFSGKFIVFEGLDGSGQSTQSELLRNFLIEKGFEAVATKEPTIDSEAGRKIREILHKKVKSEPGQIQELMVQDRKEHLENLIIPALKQGKIVISDRYFFSTFAFGASDNLDLDWLIEINNDFLYPDIIFLLKVSPKVCIERIISRGEEIALFEKEEKLAKVWQTYRILPERFDNIFVIDGEKPIDKVFEQVKTIINKTIK